MPKLEWGTKRVCPTTGKRFYDLNRTPIVSPYSGEVVEVDMLHKKVAIASAAAPSAKPSKVSADDLDADVDLLEVEGADGLDDDLLDDDDVDDVSLDEIADVAVNDDET